MPKRERSIVQGVTVDAEKARDLDDAIWVEKLVNGGYRATVSIADVASLVPIGGLDDEIAFRRGLTVYSNGVALIPKASMLSPQIARGQASLLPGRDRPVVAHVASFSADFARVSYRLERGTLHSRAKLAYEDFDRIFSGTEDLSEMARDAVTVAQALWRERIGSIGMPDWDSAFDDRGEIVPNCPKGLLGQTVVHEYMVLANVCATEVVRSRGLPMIYRNQGPRPGGPAGRYEVVCMGHQGLGKAALGQFTNPIRRFPDLVNQRIGCAAAEGAPAPYDVIALTPICAEANRAVQKAEVRSRHPEPANPAAAFRSVLPLERLDPVAFRHAARESGTLMPGTVFGRELQRRVQDGLLTHADIAWLAFGARNIAAAETRAEVLHLLTANPEEMARVWECAFNEFGLPPYDGICWREEDGWVFAARLGKDRAEATSQDPLRARGLALTRLAASVAGLTLPDNPMPPGNGLLLADMFAKAKLVSLCRLMHWSGPDFAIDDQSAHGGLHFCGHVGILAETFPYRSPIVHASSLRSAEVAASALALTALDPYADCLLLDEARRDGVDMSILDDESFVGRPLTALSEFCRRYGAKHRCVWLAEQPGEPNYECEMELSSGGNTLRAVGRGASRTTAMETASRNMVGSLLDPDRRRRAAKRVDELSAARLATHTGVQAVPAYAPH